MGTIASVLQWTCTNCNLINPTECLKCLNCGNIRRILDEDTHNGDDKQHRVCDETNANQWPTLLSTSIETKQQFSQAAADDKNNDDAGDCNGKQMSNGQWKLYDETNATTTTLTSRTENANNKISHRTLPGYVEINSNGYFTIFVKFHFLFFCEIYFLSFGSVFSFRSNWLWFMVAIDFSMHWCATQHKPTPAHIPTANSFFVLLCSRMRFCWCCDICARPSLCEKGLRILLPITAGQMTSNGQNKSITFSNSQCNRTHRFCTWKVTAGGNFSYRLFALSSFVPFDGYTFFTAHVTRPTRGISAETENPNWMLKKKFWRWCCRQLHSSFVCWNIRARHLSPQVMLSQRTLCFVLSAFCRPISRIFYLLSECNWVALAAVWGLTSFAFKAFMNV